MKQQAAFVRARPRQPRPPQAQSTGSDQEALAALMGIMPSTTARLPVTERNVFGLAGAWAALNKIANAASQMLVAAEAYGPDGRTPIPAPPVLVDPCSGYDSFVYWREVVTTALARGNWIGVKADPDPLGYPRQVVPMPIDAVHAAFDEDGYPFYEIAGEVLSPDDVVHIRLGITIPGQIMAVGVIEAHRRGLGGMLDQQQMTSSIWREGAVPTGLVQLDVDNPTADQASNVKANWQSMLEGRRTVAVIGRKMSYTPVTWSAQDAQWLESRQFSIAECALLFGLKPEDLGSSFGASSGAQTYGNRSDDSLQRITDSYLPVLLPVEQCWSRLIPGRAFVRGNPEALLRSTTRERYELHLLAQQAGLETVDESRQIEGKPKADETEEVTA